jgi:hypothetical protein
VEGADPSIQGKAQRALADEIGRIVSHQVFREWLKDPTLPKHFRDAGHFWEIAPGTPPSVIRTRIARVDNTLRMARSLLEEKGVEGIAARHGKALFDRADIDRVSEFQEALKHRFAKELATLQGSRAV